MQLDVVVAAPRERRLLIGEAKWGRDVVRRHILTDLVERSLHMPQVAEGWETTYVLFARDDFTAAPQEQAAADGVTLVTLAQIEELLGAAQAAGI